MTPSKEELRRRLRSEALLHPAEERVRDSKFICAAIERQPVWQSLRSVLFFWPLGVEPDLRPICLKALQAGKIAALPKYLPETGDYGAFRVTDVERQLARGRFGVAEPDGSCARFDLNKLDLIFVPGLGFSFDGARLGRGKGYYDRLLADLPAIKCGVAYDWQIVAEIPREAHDVRMDCVVTPQAWHEVARQS
jgi:5-formyltetrahydrofolate cyclo-ligase